MRVALVAMPWNRVDSPSPALGILAAVLRHERPGDQICCEFPYLAVGERMGFEIYSAIAAQYAIGDMLYACVLYPDRVPAARQLFVEEMSKDRHALEAIGVSMSARTYDDLFDHVYATLRDHAAGFAEELAGRHDVVGFTTTYCQLFASLAVARRLAELDPSVRIVFGGSGVAYDVGPSIVAEYPFVHHVIQGAGEHELVELLDVLSRARGEDAAATPGRAPARGGRDGDLPLPDYDGFPELAARHGLTDWVLPIEGSRGCWWDRVRKSNNPLDSCRFCTQNGGTYHEKPPAVLVREMIALSERYANTRFQFTDLVARIDGLTEFATGLKESGRCINFWWSLRANVRPYEHLLIWEAGCNEIQIGIEGLSTSYLRRIGKGTSTIQNLQAMKTCFELGMSNQSNLVTRFPGSTQDEVDETERNILDYAIVYQPLKDSPFGLEHNTSVSKRPEAFGVENIRNAKLFEASLPADVWQRLRLYAFDYDCKAEADWTKVVRALDTWRDLHRRVRTEYFNQGAFFTWAPLYYVDRGIHLDVVDRRTGWTTTRLEGTWRELYLHCMEIQGVRAVAEQFAHRQSTEETTDMLYSLAHAKLLFIEAGRCLSLAVAPFPHIAQARIRAQHPRSRPARKPALAVVG
jgi:ribosomal peptide maturation radical SAM protein 1